MAAVLQQVGQAISTGPREQRRLALSDGSTMYVDAGTSLKVTGRRSVKLSAGSVPASSLTGTTIVFAVSPGAKVSVPVLAM